MAQRSQNTVGRALFLIAAREPVPGKTKTRLGAAIGMVCAAALYAAFLVDLPDRFMPAPGERRGFDVGWAYTPADVDFARVLTKIGCPAPPSSVCFVPQEGEGWDVRQANLRVGATSMATTGRFSSDQTRHTCRLRSPKLHWRCS